jgi:hypothetical protein
MFSILSHNVIFNQQVNILFMKKITADRLITALDNIDRITHDKTSHMQEVARLYMKHGYQNVVERKAEAVIAAVQVDTGLLNLDMKQSRGAISDLVSKANHFHRWREVVARIQIGHKVSGLVRKTSQLGGNSIPTWQKHEQLSLIQSDLSLLSQEKDQTIDFFLASAKTQRHQFFIDRYGFSRCLEEDILDYARYYQWAITSPVIDDGYQLVLVNGANKDDCNADTKCFVSSIEKPRF